jgi:hypothetical protein
MAKDQKTPPSKKVPVRKVSRAKYSRLVKMRESARVSDSLAILKGLGKPKQGK